MPSRPGPKISDWVSQLGIRDMFPPQRRQHHDTCPEVDLLKEEIKRVVDNFYTMSIEDIKNSMEIRDATGALLDKHGPIIWSDKSTRPWLFNPGEGATDAPYERHLYWSNSKDNEFLEKTLYGYVLARVLRWHKDHSRDSSKGPEASRLSETPDNAPDSGYRPSPRNKPRPSTGASTSNLRCFASHNDHLDATKLREYGVWLGDWDEESRAVNGATQLEIERRYFEETLGGIEPWFAKAPMLLDLPNNAIDTAVCAACKASPNPASLRLKIVEFECTNEEDPDVGNRATLRAHAWALRCTLDGREVFALLKVLPKRESQKLGFNGRVWSFWKIDERYTTTLFVVRESQNGPFPVLKSDLAGLSPVNGKRKRNVADQCDTGDDPGPSPGKIARHQASELLQANTNGEPGPSTGRVVTTRTTRKSRFTGDGQHPADNGQANDIERTSGTQSPSANQGFASAFPPINALVNAPTLSGAVSDLNTVETALRTHVRRSSFNSMYDATPRPEARKKRASQVQSSVQAAPMAAPNAAHEARSDNAAFLGSNRPDSVVSAVRAKDAAAMPPPPRVLNFKIWFPFETAGTAEVAAKAVRFNTSMGFDAAFAHTRSKLERQLGGKQLLGMTINSKIEGRPSMLVDEEDMWDEVLDMVRETGSEELSGTVDME